jgi:hypothetical protein
MDNRICKRMQEEIRHKINQYQADRIADLLLLAVIVTGVLSTLA